MISIVMCVYNGEKFISEAIESIINQTYTSWELIIVNDASTDNTKDIIFKFTKKDKRISIIHNEQNRGQVVPDRLVELMMDTDQGKAGKVMQAMMKMQKIIIADLEAAYNGQL